MKVYHIKDLYIPDSWYVINFAIVSCALILIVPFVRRGPVWQRVIAVLLSIFPLMSLVSYCCFAVTNLW